MTTLREKSASASFMPGMMPAGRAADLTQIKRRGGPQAQRYSLTLRPVSLTKFAQRSYCSRT